jgi:hypothetical protein
VDKRAVAGEGAEHISKLAAVFFYVVLERPDGTFLLTDGVF